MEWLVELVQAATDKPLAIDSDDPDVIKAEISIKPIMAMETVEINFTLDEMPDDSEIDSDEMIVVRAAAKKAMLELKHDLERRITVKVDKQQAAMRQMQQQAQQQQVDNARMESEAYRAGLFGTSEGAMRNAYGGGLRSYFGIAADKA